MKPLACSLCKDRIVFSYLRSKSTSRKRAHISSLSSSRAVMKRLSPTINEACRRALLHTHEQSPKMEQSHLQKCFPELSTFRNAHNDAMIDKLLEMCMQSGQQTTSRISEPIQRVGIRRRNLSSLRSKVFIELIFSATKEKRCYHTSVRRMLY
jgi:hypothetical protein